MGNSGSSGVNISVNPSQSNEGFYLAGSMITGSVNVQLKEDVSPDDMNLQVQFKGKEKSHVRYRDSDETKHAFAERNIIEIDLPLGSATSGTNAAMTAGSYSYPFQFQLPDHLPTSMYATGGIGGECHIKYKIKAEIKGKKAWRSKDEDVEINVLAKPPSSEKISYFVQPVTVNIKTCCCFSRGDITFGAAADDTRVGKNETIKVDFGCKNEATTEIQYVEAYVYQHIQWNAGGRSNSEGRELVTQQFMDTDDMGARTKDQMAQLSSDADNQFASRGIDGLFREIKTMVTEGSNSISLHIPHEAKSSYSGLLINADHFLGIRIKTSGFSTVPRYMIPVQIVTPDSVSGQQTGGTIAPEPPAPVLDGWNLDQVTTAAPASTPTNMVYGGGVTGEEDIAVDPLGIDGMGGGEATLQGLLKELGSSISAKTTIRDRIADGNWDGVFASLQPRDFAAILGKVTLDFDQAEVADMVASKIPNFSCAHVVAAHHAVTEWIREQVVRKLLPHTKDLNSNSNVILSELTDWERICLERDFESSLSTYT
jgi:hypothetical protein